MVVIGAAMVVIGAAMVVIGAAMVVTGAAIGMAMVVLPTNGAAPIVEVPIKGEP